MEKLKRKGDSQVTGNVGLYYVCYRLSCIGWNVMPTARNARGVDILIYNYDASIKYSVQVKALSKRSPVPLGSKAKLEHLFADFVVVCRYVLTKPECFILTPDEVRRLAHHGEKEGRTSVWLQPRAYEAEEYREAWGRIGLGGEQRAKQPGPARGVTKRVWVIADSLIGKKGQMPSRADVVKACVADGINPGTAGVQFSKWKNNRER